MIFLEAFKQGIRIKIAYIYGNGKLINPSAKIAARKFLIHPLFN